VSVDPTTLTSATRGALDQRLATEQSRQRLPSIVAGLVRDGVLVWSGAAGTLDGRGGGSVPTPNTQYRLGSISKTFVAVEVLRLRDAGLIDLGDQIGKHLPEVPFGQVTIAQLLSHTSGLQAETNGSWWERSPGTTWETLIGSGVELRFTPGTTHHYSNVGYAVLGELIARLRSTPWTEAVQAGILAPLGMTRTTPAPIEPAAPGLAVHPLADLVHVEPTPDAVSMSPAGQLWSTVDDMTQWCAFLAGHTGDILASATLAEMLRPVAVVDTPQAPWTVAYALGWQVWNAEGRRFGGHGGSMPGFLAQLRVDLDTGDGLVLMTNATSGLDTAGVDLLDLLHEREPVAPTPWTADTDQSARLDLTGPWTWGTASFTIRTASDGALVLGDPGQGRGSRFRPEGDGFIGLDGYFRGEPMAVERDDSGRAVRLVLASFVFTRTPYEPGIEVPGGLDGTWH